MQATVNLGGHSGCQETLEQNLSSFKENTVLNLDTNTRSVKHVSKIKLSDVQGLHLPPETLTEKVYSNSDSNRRYNEHSNVKL